MLSKQQEPVFWAPIPPSSSSLPLLPLLFPVPSAPSLLPFSSGSAGPKGKEVGKAR